MNIIKGYITSVLGLAFIVTAFLDFYGILNFGHDHKGLELFAAFIIGLVLFLIPRTTIEKWLNRFINRKNREL